MSLTWLAVTPPFLAALVLMGLWMAKRLRFFSHQARDLDQIDIRNEISEVSIQELEMLLCHQASSDCSHIAELTRSQRRQQAEKRLLETSQWLRVIIANAALFQEVARFRIQAADSPNADLAGCENELPYKVMDRASMVHLMAAACLAKLQVIHFCALLWPIYVPVLNHQFQIFGHDVVTWYRDLGKEMLDLAKQYYDDLTYSRFAAQLFSLSHS